MAKRPTDTWADDETDREYQVHKHVSTMWQTVKKLFLKHLSDYKVLYIAHL